MIIAGVTLLAHRLVGVVWTWILYELNQPVTSSPVRPVTCKLTLLSIYRAMHYYGQFRRRERLGFLAVLQALLLEPLLMAAAAVVMVLLSVSSQH